MNKGELERRIAALTRELNALKRRRDELNGEAKGWAEKRNEINNQVKNVRGEVKRLKQLRDELNKKVKRLKAERENARKEIAAKKRRIAGIKRELELVRSRKPSESFKALQEQLEKLEWKIQTTPLTLEEEKRLVEKIRQTEASLAVHKKIRQLRRQKLELQAEIEALETKAETFHRQLTKTAEKSQELHQKMLEKIEKINSLRLEAEKAHQKYLEFRQQAKAVHEKLVQIADKIKALKLKLREIQEERKRKYELEIRKKLIETAKEKLKHGGKLSWEEFKALAENSVEEQG